MPAWMLPLLMLAPPECPQAAALVRGLGDDSYHRREWCQAAVERMGQHALPALKRGQRSADVEIRVRCNRAVESIDARLVASLPPPRRMPQLDSLWFNDRWHCYDYKHILYRALHGYIHRRLSERREPVPGADFSYAPWRLAMHDWCCDLLRAGVPMWAVRFVCWLAWRGELLAYPAENPDYPWP